MSEKGYVSVNELRDIREALRNLLGRVDRLIDHPDIVVKSDPPARSSNTGVHVWPKYEIGPGATSYADVVWKEVESDEFSLDEAETTIRPLIVSPAERFRDGLRQSLKRDDRFRLVRTDASGLWFAKRRPGQFRFLNQREGH